MQSSALRCTRALAQSRACLEAMAAAGHALLQPLLSHVGCADVPDILNATWIIHLIQQEQQDAVAASSSCKPLSSLQAKSGRHADSSVCLEQSEASCVTTLLHILQGLAPPIHAEAIQSKAEAACALDMLIQHRSCASGTEAGRKLQLAAAQQGGLHILAQLLSAPAPPQLHFVAALSSLVWNNSTNQAALISQGTLGSMVVLCISPCPRVSAATAACIANLLHAWPGHPMALATKMALQPLVSSLDAPSQHLQDRAARALQLIAAHGKAEMSCI